MRFMVLLKGDPAPAAAALGSYLDDLARAGVLLAAESLRPSSAGVRLRLSGDGRILTEGPFPRPDELVAGYVLVQVKSREEAIEWAARCPLGSAAGTASPTELEIREVVEAVGVVGVGSASA